MIAEEAAWWLQTFNNLSKTSSGAMAVKVQWRAGGGAVLITKAEWLAQPNDTAKLSLIESRRRHLWEVVNANHP